SLGCSPASSIAALTASQASRSSLRPDSFENSVWPIPAIAALPPRLISRLPLAPVLARSSLRSSLALAFEGSYLGSRSLRSSLVPRCDPHSRSPSKAHFSAHARSGPRSFLALRPSLALAFGGSFLGSVIQQADRRRSRHVVTEAVAALERDLDEPLAVGA